MKLLHKNSLLFPIVLLVFSPVFAGVIDNGFDALAVKDYYKAKKCFEKSINKFPVASTFGLSLIFSRNDNPYYNLDSSYQYINTSIRLFQNVSSSEKKKMAKLSIDTMRLTEQRDTVEKLAFNIASTRLDDLNFFILRYASSPLILKAIAFRDSIAYSLAVAENSADSYYKFMESYPESDLYFDAKARYDERLFAETTSEGSLESFEKFVIAYPDNAYVNAAHENIYKLATMNSLEVDTFYSFILKYPGNPYVEQAWHRIYELFFTEITDESINEFNKKYPEFPNQDQLIEDYKNSKAVMIPFEINNKWGFVNENGITVVEPAYDEVGKFVEGIAVVTRNGKYGYLAKSGEEIIPPFYDEAESFSNKLAIVKIDNKAGVIDKYGNMVIPLIYADIGDFSENLAWATDGRKYGYINRSGDTIISFRFSGAGSFENGTAVCECDNGFGIIDTKGNVVIPCEYEVIENFKGDLCRFKTNSGWGLMNKRGIVVLEPEYNELGNFHQGRAVVVKNDKAGFIDLSGRFIIPLKFQAETQSLGRSSFANGYAIIKSNNNFGVVDTNGNFIIQPVYADLQPGINDVIIFRKNNLSGFLHALQGKIIIPGRYDDVIINRNKSFIVRKKEKYGVVDNKGIETIPVIYNSVNYQGNDLYILEKNNRYGLSDLFHDLLLPFEYDQIEIMDEAFLMLESSTGNAWYNTIEKKVILKPGEENILK